VYNDLDASTTPSQAADFASRGKVGPAGYCAGSDTYTVTGSNSQLINIWQAYKDGVWTSSTTIKIYIKANTGFGGNIYAQPEYKASSVISIHKAVTNLACGATAITATVTVNDDGTFSIA
jgi:hypothetical protein